MFMLLAMLAGAVYNLYLHVQEGDWDDVQH